MAARRALLFRQYNQTNIAFFNQYQTLFFSLLFLTVPVISHVLISQGNTLKSNYFLSTICGDLPSLVYSYNSYFL